MPRLVRALGIYIVSVTLIAVATYFVNRYQYLSDIDTRLVAAAKNIPKILPPDFHDRAVSAASITPQEDQKNLEQLSLHAATGGVAYLYTYVMQNNTVYFTSSSYTDDDVKFNNVSRYWTDYPEGKPVFFAALQTDRPLFETYSDRWGTFRSVLIRFHSPQGNDYIAAADIDISVIEHALWWRVLATILMGVVMLGLAFPFVRTFPHAYATMNNELLQLNKYLGQQIALANDKEAGLNRSREDSSQVD